MLCKATSMHTKDCSPSAQEWCDLGRMLVSLLSWPSGMQLAIVNVYGFAKGHENKGMNEELLMSGLSWQTTLTIPCILCGDLNETRMSSQALGLAENMGLHHVGPEGPTTKGRDTPLSHGGAIDHCIANTRAKDLHMSADLEYEASFSVHFALKLTFWLPKVEFSVWRWPRVVPLEHKDVSLGRVADFKFDAKSIMQWEYQATKWLERACDVKIPDRHTMTTTTWSPNRLATSKPYAQLFRARAAVMHMIKEGIMTEQHTRSLRRKLLALDPPIHCFPSVSGLMHELDTRLQKVSDDASAKAIAEWKTKVRSWCVSDKAVYKFVRNQPHAKPTALMVNQELTTQPDQMGRALHNYWHNLQEWPDEDAYHRAKDAFENWYAHLLPRNYAKIDVNVRAILGELRTHKRSAPGH